jgi:hypothetical protein
VSDKLKGRRYPWKEWFELGKFTIYKGKHYNGLDHAFSQYTRRAAKRHGYLISLTMGEGSITVRVEGRTEECPEVHSKKK